MEYIFCRIKDSLETIEQASVMLMETFPKADMWPDLDETIAKETVDDSIGDKNICIGLKIDNELIGWVCLSPMYEKTWELHPMVIKTEFQGKGYGKILLNELERIAREMGIIGIILSSGEETNKTSLSEKEIIGEKIIGEIEKIKNYKNHPYEFYIKCGYSIYGLIPNAYGLNKPDIMLWKDIRKK